jgi:vacuolar-type H+-ATPase subunit I/STV1
MKTTPISEKISTNVAAKEQEEQEQKEYNKEESSSNEVVEIVSHHKNTNSSNFSKKLKRNIAGMSYKWVKVVKMRKEEEKKREEKEKERQQLERHENDKLYREAIAQQTQHPQARVSTNRSSIFSIATATARIFSSPYTSTTSSIYPVGGVVSFMYSAPS